MAPRERTAAIAALREIPATFGRPHERSGAGVRQLRPGVYETRIGLQLRAIFVREVDAIVVTMLATHEDVRRYLRAL